jgi:hypothetical protein
VGAIGWRLDEHAGRERQVEQVPTPWEGVAKRRAHPLNQPLPATVRWASNFPDGIRPFALLKQFPRIANMLARTWTDQPALESYLESLLTDRRGGRRGFPPEVLNELLTLRYIAETRSVV